MGNRQTTPPPETRPRRGPPKNPFSEIINKERKELAEWVLEEYKIPRKVIRVNILQKLSQPLSQILQIIPFRVCLQIFDYHPRMHSGKLVVTNKELYLESDDGHVMRCISISKYIGRCFGYFKRDFKRKLFLINRSLCININGRGTGGMQYDYFFPKKNLKNVEIRGYLLDLQFNSSLPATVENLKIGWCEMNTNLQLNHKQLDTMIDGVENLRSLSFNSILRIGLEQDETLENLKKKLDLVCIKRENMPRDQLLQFEHHGLYDFDKRTREFILFNFERRGCSKVGFHGSDIVDNAFIRVLTEYLPNLDDLYLSRCKKLTEECLEFLIEESNIPTLTIQYFLIAINENEVKKVRKPHNNKLKKLVFCEFNEQNDKEKRKKIASKFFSLFENCIRLETVVVRNTWVANQDFKALKSVKSLLIESSSIDWKLLSKNDNIRHVLFDMSQFYDQSMSRSEYLGIFQPILPPNTTVLTLVGTSLGDDTIVELKNPGKVRILDVWYTHLTFFGIGFVIKNWKSIQEIHFSKHHVESRGSLTFDHSDLLVYEEFPKKLRIL